MGFRQKQTEHNSSQSEFALWLKQHSDLIAASGVPAIVFSNQDHWFEFLEYGCLRAYDATPDFHVNELSIRQKAALLRLLKTTRIYRGETGPVWNGLLADLLDAVEQWAPEE